MLRDGITAEKSCSSAFIRQLLLVFFLAFGAMSALLADPPPPCEPTNGTGGWSIEDPCSECPQLPEYQGSGGPDPAVSPEDFGCNGYDEEDDWACWQAAICAAKQPSNFFFGTVQARPVEFDETNEVLRATPRYIISQTLHVPGAYGGLIDGNNAVFEWRGPNNGDPSTEAPFSSTHIPNDEIPMWLLESTYMLELRNMKIEVVAGQNKLDTVFEFAYGRPEGITPLRNIIDHVHVGGTNTAGVDYGVRFSTRFLEVGNTEGSNNDQSTIMNSNFELIRKVAISIEHGQSHQHRFYAVNAGALEGNEDFSWEDDPWTSGEEYGAAFVRTGGGGFTSIGGYRGGFRLAEFHLLGFQTPVTIIDSNSEDCGPFIRTYQG